MQIGPVLPLHLKRFLIFNKNVKSMAKGEQKAAKVSASPASAFFL